MPREIYWSPHLGITRTWPLEKLLNTVAAAGYAGIEALVTPAWMNWKGPQDVARLRRMMDDRSLECPAVSWRGNQGDLLFTDPKNYATSKAYLIECVETVSALGGKAVLVWPRIAEGVSRPDAMAASARVLNDVAPVCLERGVNISLEFESRGNPLCGTPAETLELIALTGGFVTICCDTIHLYNRGLDAFSSVLPQRGHIGLVHLSDSERGVPGDGQFDFPAFVRALREIDCRAPIFVQIDPKEEPDIARAYQRAREIVAPLG